MRSEKNHWRNAGDGGPLGTRPSYGGPPATVVLIIMALGFCHCAENPHIPLTPAPAGPSPPLESQVERAKRVLGVTDQPLTDTASPTHPQDIRKVLTSMRKGLLAKKSLEAKVPEDSHGGTASPSKTNQGLIRSILKAVSDVEGDSKEAEEKIEDRKSVAGKREQLPSTHGREGTDDAGGGGSGSEGRSKGKGKLVKAISEGVLSREDLLPEQLETPTDAPPPTEEVAIVGMQDKVDREGGTVNGEVPNSVEVTEVLQRERKSVLMQADIGGGGGDDDSDGGGSKRGMEGLEKEGESEVKEVKGESEVKEINGESGSTETEKVSKGKETRESERTGTEESRETRKEEQAGNGKEGKGDKEEEEMADRKEGKEEEAGGTNTETRTTATAEKEKEDVQPLGSGIEVVTKVLGVLDVKVGTGPGNVSISPAPVVDSRQSILSKKTDVTLSHILGAKEFFSSFPAENFTYLRTPKSWAGHSQLSYKASTAKKTLVQHKTEEKEESELVREGSAADVEVSPAADGAKEDNSLSTPTIAQKTEDGVESQRRSDAEVPAATEATEKTESSPAETKDAQQIEVVEKTQQQKEKSQVESTKEGDHPSETPAGDTETEKESSHPQKATESSAAEAEVVTEAPQIPLEQPTEEKVTEETEMLEDGPAIPESRNETEETVKAEGEAEAVAAVDSEVQETTGGEVNVTEKEKVASAVPEAEEEKEEKDKPATDSDNTEEISKKKKKPSEPEKAKKKDAAEKSADAKVGEREKTSDTLETYSQFTQRVNAEKKNDIVSNGHGSNGHGKGPKVKSKNYASPDCGSKLLTANPEASHVSKVIHSNKDEYLLNKCRDKTWFVIELCESIRPQKFDIANFELFSNLPKDIHVLGSHRYPSRDWTPLARARGQEGNRGVQSFPIETEDFFKYIKVEVHSHYGSEFFCPISLFRIYGLSEFEVIDTVEEPEEPEEPEEAFIDAQPEEKKAKEEGKPSVIPAVIKNMFSGVLDVIKRGYRPHSASSEPGDSCYSLHPSHAVDKMTCQLAESLNYILSCYHAEYQVLMRRPFVSQIVKNSGFCRLLASTMCLMPEVSDSVVYDTACNSSYLCIMLSPKHMLAMCFMHDSRIMDSQVACESDSGTLLPENFSATTPAIMPPENGIPPYVKNAKINTSTITRTDTTVPNLSGALTPDSQDKGAKQFPVDHVSASPEEPTPSGAPDASAAEISRPKKVKTAGGSHDRGVKEAEQPDNTTEPEEGVQVEGSGFVGLELTEEESAKEDEEKQEEELPVHVTPLPVEPKVSSTSPTNKESVVVRLSNKIKALEYNMSISSQYLEELSRRYKRQMEEMQRQFNLTIAALNATSRQAFERDQHHQRDIEALERQLASVSDILGKLVEERESLAHTVVEQHLLLMVVEVVVLCVVFVLCHKRTSRDRLMQLEGQDRRAQTPSEDPSDRQVLGDSSSSSWSRGRVRRRSVDSITRERSGRHRRCRRPSEEALRISGTYEDLLIIEPAIPIMVDSVSDRKKKKKSSSGTLKRSKSNASIVEKSCSSTRRSRRIETLDMSSAGVLFCGDQVEAKEAPTTSQTDSASPHFPSTPQEPPGSATIASRSFVEEVTSDGHPHSGTQTSKRHSLPCCQNPETVNKKGSKLSKSHSVSCASEKLTNGAEKKKMKKLKKKNFNQDSQHQFIHESEFYPEVNGTSYNGHGEHIPEYYYNGRNSVHFSETTDTLGSHIFSADVPDSNSYVNGSSSVDHGYVGSDYMHSGYTSSYSDRQRTSPVPKVKLRSDNWEWYSLQHFGSSSETVSTCSDSSNKVKKGKHDEVPHITEQSNDKKAKKKKKSKSRSAAVLEEETNGGT